MLDVCHDACYKWQNTLLRKNLFSAMNSNSCNVGAKAWLTWGNYKLPDKMKYFFHSNFRVELNF